MRYRPFVEGLECQAEECEPYLPGSSGFSRLSCRVRFSYRNDNVPGHQREEGERRLGVHYGLPGVREKERHDTLRRAVSELESAELIWAMRGGEASFAGEGRGLHDGSVSRNRQPRERSTFGEKTMKPSLKARVKSTWKGSVASWARVWEQGG